jgi:hypothetical protein
MERSGGLVGWCLRLAAAVMATSLLLAVVVLAGVDRFPYFLETVTRTLLGDHALDAALGPAGSAARRQAVFEGGLRIRTTLRPADQRLAETAARDRLAGAGVDAALASVDPASGAVVAMVGGRDFARSRVNLVTWNCGGPPPSPSTPTTPS